MPAQTRSDSGNRSRDRLLLAAKLLFAALAVTWLARSGSLDPSGLALRDRWHWLLLAQIPFGLTFPVSAWRWQILMRARGIQASFADALRWHCIAWLFNQLVIGTTGGDVYRAWAAARDHPEQRGEAVMSVFADRVIGLFVLLIVVVAIVPFELPLVRAHPSLVSSGLLVVGAIFGTLAAAVLYGSRRLRAVPALQRLAARLPGQSLLARLDDAAMAYRSGRRELYVSFALSLLLHGLIIASNALLALAVFDVFPGAGAFLLLVPLAHVAMAIPVNPPGAIGTAEAIYAYLFALVGAAQGAYVALLYRATIYAWALPGVALWLSSRRDR